jgi:ATP-dependent Clp protease ATP-binding subunit ClpA
MLRGLFEKFTERARQVVVLAQEESRALKHTYIGTEHILLGLLREHEGAAAHVLHSLGVTIDGVREQVIEIVGHGEEPTSGQIPFTPRAKKVLELSLRESLNLGHTYIGTEHILLGLNRENEGVATHILLHFDANADTIRTTTLETLAGSGGRWSADVKATAGRRLRYTIDQAWLPGLGGVLNDLAREIRRELEREPDIADLLITLACAPDTLASQALHRLRIDLDQLEREINTLRDEVQPGQHALAAQIEEVRQAKERAIESQDFEIASRMRDQERQLRQTNEVVTPEVLQQIRRHLGIPTPTDDSLPPST